MLPKLVLTGIITAAVVFFGLFCYSFFANKEVVTIYTNTPKTDYLKPPFVKKPFVVEKVVDTIAAAEVKKIVAKKKRAAAAAKAKEKLKKKRKKFLGIF
jgi:hypothetical protein